jgi:ATPases involved in chromosome partitioning
MFKKVGVDILGIVENMSYFICSNCNKRHEIFSHGGVKEESKKQKVNFLGELPIDQNLRIGSDDGFPICISNPESEIAKKYFEIANKINLQFNN